MRLPTGRFLPVLPTLFALLISGCGVSTPDTSVTGTLTLMGRVHGGQNGVAGSTVGLYVAGTSGTASMATNILNTAVFTDAAGSFGLTNKYHCVNSTDQVYITATGGDSGGGVSNPALVMLAALGDCGNLNANTYITINEVTTVAAAWAIGQFAADFSHVGATSTNAKGVRNAFLNSQLLADSSIGVAATPPSNIVVEQAKLYALANAIAPCINSTGSTGGPCGTLFNAATPLGGTGPSNTFNAALNIVKNPGNNVGTIFSLIPADSPFPTTMTQAPSDWSLSMKVTGGGIIQPTGIQLDSAGNVWVADYPGLLSGFSSQGAPLNATGFGSGQLQHVLALTVDTADNVWVASSDYPSHYPSKGGIMKFYGVPAGANAGTLIGTYADSTIDYPEGLYADTNGTIDVANYAGGSGEILDLSGNIVAAGLGGSTTSFVISILPDASHGVWLANESSGTVTHVSASGTVLSNSVCCDTPYSLAGDSAGNVWIANYGNSSVSELSPAGSLLLTRKGGSDIMSPSAVAVDGNQDVWLTNYSANTLSKVAGNSNTMALVGTGLSPSTGIGVDAALGAPYSFAIDASGDIWVTNRSHSNLVMFFGLAGPTKTPVHPQSVAP